MEFLNQYRLELILTVATAFGYFWIYQFKETLRIKGWMALLLSAAHTLVGVLCVKIFAFLESGDGSGMSLYGAIFFLPAIYFLLAKIAKRKVSDVFDIFAICTICTLLCARFNCILAGCCLGSCLPGNESLRWPTRELEIIFYVILYISLRGKVCKKKYSGMIYPIYMIAYGAFRFVVEFFRESNHIFGILHISHIWSLIAIAIGIVVCILLSRPVKCRDRNKKNLDKQSNTNLKGR